jgi:hypothetical protein
MIPGQLLDPIPVVAVFVLFVILSGLAYEGGYRLGRARRTPTGEHAEASGLIVGALLALMAFLLAVTMTMASDRFDTRRGLVIDEANAIGTAYLRAGFLPERERDASRERLREYVPLQVNPGDPAQLVLNDARSDVIKAELWRLAEEGVASGGSSDVLATYIETLNEMFDFEESRETALLVARVPETIVLLLFAGTLLSLGMVGYHGGLTGARSPLAAAAMILALSAVLALVVDLDRPRDGFLEVSQQPLIDVQQQIGS